MTSREDSMSQGPTPVVSDSTFLNIISSHEDRAVTTREVAKEVEITKAGVYSRLEQLKDEGKLTKKEVGSRAVVWWVSDQSSG
jgi:Fe2+ or Zn2+ uptake regulation protein